MLLPNLPKEGEMNRGETAAHQTLSTTHSSYSRSRNRGRKLPNDSVFPKKLEIINGG